jgi:hypothetical protein
MPKKKAPSKPAAAKTKAPAKPAAKATPVKASATKPVAKKTTIVAQVDVGWGNSLHLRGQGGGLSWDVGVLMTCKKDSEWVWSAPASAGTITFKFVRNDLHWALGPNQTVRAGATSVSTPDFPSWESLGR